MSSRFKLRVEDVLTLITFSALLIFARTRASLTLLSLDEGRYWELSFIMFPAALLVFIASARYAFDVRAELNATVLQVTSVLRDWMPFALFLSVYESFRSGVWAVILGPDRDAQLLAIDRWMLGETPSITMQRFISPLLTNMFILAYFLHLVLPGVLAIALYRRDLLLFRRFLLAVFISGVIGSSGYIAVPAVGPGIAYAPLFTVSFESTPADPLLGMMDLARAARDVFPSLHVAVSSIVLWYAARAGRKWLLGMLPLVIANWIATMYLRYHYFIDVIAGWACAALAIALTALLLEIERRITSGAREREAAAAAHPQT